jgi:predicted DNA-binding protein (UPF0251 family)
LTHYERWFITVSTMSRPISCRRISGTPGAVLFKPAGIPVGKLGGPVRMTLDEFEALRLTDLEGLYQEEVAERMGVSRPTICRILEAAHRKVAEALVRGKALRIEGGNVETGCGEPPGCAGGCARGCCRCARRDGAKMKKGART